MATPVVLVPGDGIGPSMASAVVRILDDAGGRAGLDIVRHRLPAPNASHTMSCRATAEPER